MLEGGELAQSIRVCIIFWCTKSHAFQRATTFPGINPKKTGMCAPGHREDCAELRVLTAKNNSNFHQQDTDKMVLSYSGLLYRGENEQITALKLPN